MSAVWAENATQESETLSEYSPSPRSQTEAKANSKGNIGASCAVAFLEGSSASSPSTKKLLPAIRSKNEGRESLSCDSHIKGSVLQKDFIPVDILNSLTQIPSPPSREQLGPPTKFKKNIVEKPNIRKRPANVWHFNKGRDKLKHLVENPPCLCGAGRDISFLYDVLVDKKSDKPRSVNQSFPTTKDKCQEEKKNEEPTSETKDNTAADVTLIPNTLVPTEYHLVKNPGVLGLEFADDTYTTYLKEHGEHLTIFPSMKPAGRQEVLKLKHAFETLLTRAGIDDESKELTGPTQIHNLLEIVKKEQNIYNIIFNELIRQCTVECAERGELLANLRKKYAQLLDRVPRQVMSLHQEVLAQRALDRRLTEELVRFKTSVSALTNELAVVKAHDHLVTKQALQVQEELHEALMESEKNANLLEEYHELYELQRKRLETFVRTLTEERDLWGSAAYILALKVTGHHKLNVAKRLHLHERAWSKLARHFSLCLSQRDSEQLQDVVMNFQTWKELAEKFNNHLTQRESSSKVCFQKVVAQLERWRREFERVVSPNEGRVQPPGKELIEELLHDMKSWEELFNKEAEKFAGGNLLSCHDQLYHLYKKVETWTDLALKVFRRHQENGQNVSYNDEMSKINEIVERLHQQFQIRANGENGVAKGLIDMSNPMESWCNKLTSVINGAEEMLDPEWIRLSDQVGNEWLENMKVIVSLIGSSRKEDDERPDECFEITKVDLDELCKTGKTWLTNMTNGIESEDGKLMQIVSDVHSTILRWMITVLLRLAPDVEDRDLEEISTEDDLKGSLGGGEILLESTSQEIKTRAGRLAQDLRTYSQTLNNCCSNFVMASMLEKKDRYEEDAEVEYNDLKRLVTECEGWIRTSEILVKQVVGEMPLEGVQLSSETATPVEGIRTESVQKVSGESEGSTSTSRSTPVKGGETTEGSEGIGGTPKKTSPSSDTREPNDSAGQSPLTIKEQCDNDNEQGETEQDESKEEPSSCNQNKMRVLADDDTVRTRLLKDGEIQQIATLSEELQTPVEPTQRSSDGLATLEKLQNELLEAEGRAQRAEERALNAESELKVVLEKLRALDRASSRPTSAQSTELSVKTATSAKTGTSSRALPRQPSHASSGASSNRKKQ